MTKQSHHFHLETRKRSRTHFHLEPLKIKHNQPVDSRLVRVNRKQSRQCSNQHHQRIKILPIKAQFLVLLLPQPQLLLVEASLEMFKIKTRRVVKRVLILVVRRMIQTHSILVLRSLPHKLLAVHLDLVVVAVVLLVPRHLLVDSLLVKRRNELEEYLVLNQP